MRATLTIDVMDEDIRERLADALEGGGAFRRFQRVVDESPDLDARPVGRGLPPRA